MPSERESIAISEVAVYVAFLPIAGYVFYRHGFLRQIGWMYLVIFCGLRVASGIMGIEYAKHPLNRTDGTWSAILGSIGLSPLFLVGMGLLERVNRILPSRKVIIVALHLLHLPIILGLLLAVIGGTKLSSTDHDKEQTGQKYEKAGGVVFLLSYIGLLGLAMLTMIEIRNLPWGERRVLISVLAALPLLAVRLLYSLLADFANDNTFSILGGNATVQLCMAILEEMVVTVFFLITGVMAPSFRTFESQPEQLALNQKGAHYVREAA